MARKKTSSTTRQVVIDLPQCEPDPESYTGTQHIQLHLTTEQRIGVKALMLGLRAQGRRLDNGRLVTSPTDTVRWLLEQTLHQTNGQSAKQG